MTEQAINYQIKAINQDGNFSKQADKIKEKNKDYWVCSEETARVDIRIAFKPTQIKYIEILNYNAPSITVQFAKDTVFDTSQERSLEYQKSFYTLEQLQNYQHFESKYTSTKITLIEQDQLQYYSSGMITLFNPFEGSCQISLGLCYVLLMAPLQPFLGPDQAKPRVSQNLEQLLQKSADKNRSLPKVIDQQGSRLQQLCSNQLNESNEGKQSKQKVANLNQVTTAVSRMQPKSTLNLNSNQIHRNYQAQDKAPHQFHIKDTREYKPSKNQEEEKACGDLNTKAGQNKRNQSHQNDDAVMEKVLLESMKTYQEEQRKKSEDQVQYDYMLVLMANENTKMDIERSNSLAQSQDVKQEQEKDQLQPHLSAEISKIQSSNSQCWPNSMKIPKMFDLSEENLDLDFIKLQQRMEQLQNVPESNSLFKASNRSDLPLLGKIIHIRGFDSNETKKLVETAKQLGAKCFPEMSLKVNLIVGKKEDEAVLQQIANQYKATVVLSDYLEYCLQNKQLPPIEKYKICK